MRILIAIMAALLFLSCSKRNTTSEFQDAFSGARFLFYDLEDRKALVNDYFQAMGDSYGALRLKEERIGKSIEELRIESIEEEIEAQKNHDAQIDEIEKYFSSLPKEDGYLDAIAAVESKTQNDFWDRMFARTANFDDTHLALVPSQQRPIVSNGLLFERIQGEVYLTGFTRIVARLRSKPELDYAKLNLGLRLIAVDGVAVEEYVNQLGSFVSSSSNLHKMGMATKKIGQRNFFYPTKNSVVYRFLSEEKNEEFEIELPWYRIHNTGDTSANWYLNSVGIEFYPYYLQRILNELEIAPNALTSQDIMALIAGYDELGRAPVSINYNTESNFYADANRTQPVMMFGSYESNNNTYKIITLKSFQRLKLIGYDGSQKIEYDNILSPLRSFVQEAQQNNYPIILDLRDNGGGAQSLAEGLVKLFLRADQKIPAPSRAYRITRNLQMILQNTDQSSDGQKKNQINLAVELAKMQGLEYTDPFNSLELLEADPYMGSFTGKLAILIGPNCVSACDLASHLLQKSGNAVLIGTPTNGTGLGFTGNNTWVSRFGIMSMSMPNYMFGIAEDLEVGNNMSFDGIKIYSLENNPILPDIAFETTIEMFVNADENRGQEWLDKAVEVLDGVY